MNRRGFLSTLGAGIASLAMSTRLATASIKPAADFVPVEPDVWSVKGGTGADLRGVFRSTGKTEMLADNVMVFYTNGVERGRI